jgi:hypothetical protein
MRVSVSVPITSTCLQSPLRMNLSATPSANTKPNRPR